MTLRDLQREATRALLLGTAARLVSELGADAATTRAVARAAGVASGTVFAHFPDRTALLEALLHDHVQAALDATLGGLREGDVIERLVAVAQGLWAAYDRDPQLSRALLSQTLFLADPQRPLARQLRRFAEEVGGWLAEAAAGGEIEPVEPELAFQVYFSTYFGLLVGGLRGEVPPSARGERLRTILARVLRPSAAVEVP